MPEWRLRSFSGMRELRFNTMPIRKTAGTNLRVDLPTSVSGAVARVDGWYGLSWT